MDDWAAEALGGLAAKTIRSHVDLLCPVTMLIGSIPLRDLTAHDVRRALSTENASSFAAKPPIVQLHRP